MSFLPDNAVDKIRKQREYKAALDAQVGLKERLPMTTALREPNTNKNASNLPAINAIRQPQTQFQFATDDPRPPLPRFPDYTTSKLSSDDPRVLIGQMEKLAWNLRSTDQLVQGLQSDVIAQEHKLRQDVNNMTDSFSRFSQGELTFHTYTSYTLMMVHRL